MYISLAWDSSEDAAATDEAAIDAALAALDFKNVYKPMDGFLFANTPGNTKTRVDDLQQILRGLSITFAISATQRGWLMWRSTDVSLDKCRKIADYAD